MEEVNATNYTKNNNTIDHNAHISVLEGLLFVVDRFQ